jgi:hypothetical protein
VCRRYETTSTSWHSWRRAPGGERRHSRLCMDSDLRCCATLFVLRLFYLRDCSEEDCILRRKEKTRKSCVHGQAT